jgi:hypothetical protein
MSIRLDKVHSHGMSESNSTYLVVDAFYDHNQRVEIEPPLRVIFEGENASRIAVNQGVQTARYDDDELQRIGEGSSVLGLNRVIGEIALNGNLVYGATKPLHPDLVDGQVIAPAELPAPRRELTS